MKRRFIILLVLSLFICMLSNPQLSFLGAQEGLLLWFQTVLPTLFPFMLISNILLESGAAEILSGLSYPFLGPFFRISKSGTYAVIVGFLCGYPMGSKAVASLYERKQISYSEANYLLSFCNNPSPMFFISYVVLQNLQAPNRQPSLFTIFYLSIVCSSFIFRLYYNPSFYLTLAKNPNSITANTANKQKGHAQSSHAQLHLNACMMDAISSITYVGGYMIIFCVFTKILSTLPFTNGLYNYVLLPSFEITFGISNICQSSLNLVWKCILTLGITSFGGWCSIAQTQCMLQESSLPIKNYIIEKLVTAVVTSLFAICYLGFIM